MKRYTLSMMESMAHVPEHPERTATRPAGILDTQYQVWSNRKAMVETIKMQQKRAAHRSDWRHRVFISDGE